MGSEMCIRDSFKAYRSWFKKRFSRVLLLTSATFTNGVLAAYRGPADVGQIGLQFKLGLKSRGLPTNGLSRISTRVLQ